MTKEFLEEHLTSLRRSKEQLMVKVNQHDGAIAMAQLAVNRLAEPEPEEEEEEPNAG